MSKLIGVYPISNENTSAIPVRDIVRGSHYYITYLGFELVSHGVTRAVLQRDGVQLGLIRDESHQPETAGSFYFEVSDVEEMYAELQAKGAKAGPIHIQQHDGQSYRVFFVRECDVQDTHEGYCFCFGQKMPQ